MAERKPTPTAQQTRRRAELARLRAELTQRRLHAFDGLALDSRPTPIQESVLRDKDTLVHWIVAGNRCLAKGTLIATPTGPRAIEDLRPGDIVYNEHAQPIEVLETFDNGPSRIADLTGRGRVWAACTGDHVWLARCKDRNDTLTDELKEVPAEHLLDKYNICRTYPHADLGTKSVPAAYVIGALLGNGCSRQRGNQLWISAPDDRVPVKITSLLGSPPPKRGHASNYNWIVGNKDSAPEQYFKWCSGRYAHEKIVDLQELKTWDRKSLVSFVAGLIDSDGALTATKDTVTLRISMQAKSVLEAAEYAFLALWAVPVVWSVDKRDKYKNGSVHTIRIRNPHDVRRIMQELDPEIVTPQRKWKEEYNERGGRRSSENNVRLRWGANPRVEHTYDIQVKSDTNLYLLANGLVTHNSGKSAIGGRIVSWWFNNEHPYMDRPAEWGDGPLQILVVGRLGEQIVSELYERKIKPFLTPGDYKPVKVGNELKRLEHKNGNRIIFLSHHDAANAREKAQAFTSHVVWLDEMPDDAGIVTELVMRTLTNKGRFYATFTPLVRNEEIRRMADAEGPSRRMVKFNMLDNPVFKGREAEVEAEMRAMCSSEAEYRARMYGDWYYGDTRVFAYDAKRHRRMPEDYSPAWRHVAIIDPAASGLAGLIVGAEQPSTGHWFVVKAVYLQGTSAVELLAAAEQEVDGYNLVAKWCDNNPAGFHKEASRQGKHWRPIEDKADRKLDTINAVNIRYNAGTLFLMPAAHRLEDEQTLCSWADRHSEKIIAASKYHLSDCLRYLVDVVPKWEPGSRPPMTEEQAIRHAWKKKTLARADRARRQEAARKMQVVQRRGYFGPRSRPGRWTVDMGGH